MFEYIVDLNDALGYIDTVDFIIDIELEQEFAELLAHQLLFRSDLEYKYMC